MRATNHHRPYQGYPYVTPPVNDAPSIDAATASRWSNLPRRQQADAVRRPAVLPLKPDPETSPVVYIDMPETSGSCVSIERRESIDYEEPEPSTYSHGKRKSTEEPVVYIDMPDTNGSDVARTPDNEDRQDEPEYVQETIFYNPFENRRMEMHKDETMRDSESDDESIASSQSPRRPLPPIRPSPPIRPLPPIRPTNLDLYGAGSSVASSPNLASTSSAGLTPYMTKETMLYGQDDIGIRMTEFPVPPPAYTEIDRVSSPVVDQEPVVEQPRRVEPPRTQVILPGDPAPHPTTPIGIPNPDRKYLNCHHCGMRVHTLVVKENGPITHTTAILCFIICMIPCVAFIYCTDVLKIKNHYCPSCNKIIGYELPFGSEKIVYVN